MRQPRNRGALPQREGIFHAVGRDAGAVNHLRFDLMLLVCAEKRIVDQIPVIARDVGRRPDRIEYFEVSLCDKPEFPPARLSADRWRCNRR
jgi:hypothetical protein